MSKHKPREFCTRGHDVRSDDAVYKYTSKQGHLVRDCKICARTKSRRRTKQSRDNHLWRVFKIKSIQYNMMLKAQGGKCKICDTTEPGGYQNRHFHIDHDRSCCPGKITCGKCIRGLLCSNCNTALGYANDNIDTLLSMVDYLMNQVFHKLEAGNLITTSLCHD